MMKLLTTYLYLLVLIAGSTRVALAAPSAEFSSAPANQQSTVEQLTTQDQAASTAGWESIPLPSGVTTATINGFTVHPTNARTAFLATGNGLYKTTDAGLAWAQIEPALFSTIFEVIIGIDNPQRIYVRSWDLFRSDDDGATWTKVSIPASVCGIAIAPSLADRIYARKCNDAQYPSLWRSNDGGQNWTPATTETKTFSALVVSPQQPDLLAAISADQVLRSTDGGATWVQSQIGIRYAGKLLFDLNAPYTLYLGHWTGLMRSQNGGETWEDSSADREFSTFIIAPDGSGTLLGGSQIATWHLTSDNTGWRASAWNTPQQVRALWSSATDDSVIYAMNGSGVWRQTKGELPQPFTATNFLFLPLVQRDTTISSAALGAIDSAPADEQAIERANIYRARVGAIPLRVHPAITDAAQNHAAYYMANYTDPSALTYGPHGEVENKQHYTGRRASDRIKVAGFAWAGGAEVMHFVGDPTISVDDWAATVYHRLLLLDPNAHYAGYGLAKDGRGVDVMDFAGGPTETGIWSSALPHPLGYPANGQTDVPRAWLGNESPSPLPPGVQRPVGYPFTLQGVGGKLAVTKAELRTADGQVVPVHPNPAGCADANCYTLIATTPLQPSTVYIVEASGTVEGVAFQQQWQFTTAAGDVAAGEVAAAELTAQFELGPVERAP